MAFTSDANAKLMRNLKVIRTANYALTFCDLLMGAQKVNDECNQQKKKQRRSFPNDPSHDKNIFDDVKKILNREPVDGLVKIFFKALCVPKERRCQEKKQLLNILSKSESEEGPEYLTQLIRAVESLVDSFIRPELYDCCPDVREEIYGKKLASLKEFTLCYARHRMEKVFSEIFWLGVEKYDYSSEEKKEFIDLVVEAMPYIETLVKKLCYDFEYAFGLPSLQQRSSLLFIRDFLADYSAEHKDLKELISSLDDIMKAQDNMAVWSYYPDLYDPSDDSSRLKDEDVHIDLRETLEEFNDAGGRYVPKEHTWWQVYKKAYFH